MLTKVIEHNKLVLNPFHATGVLLYSLKNVFRRKRKRPVARNRLLKWKG